MTHTEQMTIGLSIDRILESVYAVSAAEHITRGFEKPELLNTTQAPMLRKICHDVIAGIIFAFARNINSSNISDTTSDIVEIELRDQMYINLHLIRRTIEITAAAGVLAVVWQSSQAEYAQTWRDSYEKSCESLRYVVDVYPNFISPTA